MDIKKKCEWCGQSFITHSFDARFCSKRCTGAAYREQVRRERMEAFVLTEERKELRAEREPLVGKNVLSPTEAAQWLGVSRATMYRYLATNHIRCLQIRGRTFIRRADIDRMFDNAPDYRKRRNARGRKPVSQHYTMRQIMERYNISKKMVMARCEKYQVAKFYQGRNVYYGKEDVEKYFKDVIVDFNRADYYTIEEIKGRYGMSHGAVLSFVMRHRIPRIVHGKERFYSKLHIDNLKGVNNGVTDPNYYTTAEIIEKYHLTKDQVSYMLKTYRISRLKVGKYNRISRIEFDKALIETRGNFEVLVAKKPEKRK